MFSIFFKDELHSTKWDRFRIDYEFLERVLKAKEYRDPNKKVKKPLSIQSTVK